MREFEAIIAYLEATGTPHRVTSTTGGTHAPGSYHYRGLPLRRCGRCGLHLPVTDFYRRKSGPQSGRLMNLCKPCAMAKATAWRQAHPDNVRLASRRSRAKILHGKAAQPGPCAICGQEGPRVTDHDHGCCPGERSCENCRRGYLCNRCNKALGGFRDDPALLRAAAIYLEAPPGV